MMQIFLSVISIVGAILLVIGVHEYGHLCMARLLGVKVLRFNMGFGKPLWSRTAKNGIIYAVSPILLGGYVKLLDEREGPVPEALRHNSLTYQPAWKRWLILFAGPGINVLLSLVFFWTVLVIGLPELKPVVGTVTASSLAQKAGVQSGDLLLRVDNQAVLDWMGVQFHLIDAFGSQQTLTLMVQHMDGQHAILTLPLETWKMNSLKPNLLRSLGIQPSSNTQLKYIKKEQPLQAMIASGMYVANYAKITSVILYKVITGKLSIRSLGGPITWCFAAEKNFKKGMIFYVFFLGFFSVSVGVFNLLPVPGLDGFQILIVFIEKIMRHAMSNAVQILLYQLGLIAMGMLFVQLVLNDMNRLA